MWAFTKLGFFSVVEDNENRALVKVRARVKEDIKSLREYARAKGIKNLRLQQTPEADYRWRMSMVKKDWAKIVAMLALEISYGNFKNEVLTDHQAPRGRAYMDVWLTMVRFQEESNTFQQSDDPDDM